MKLERLTVRNFRNLDFLELAPDERLNFLVGSNGQGKTSILEAIGYLSSLRSFRGSKSAEVIRWGESLAEISAFIQPEKQTAEDAGDWRTTLKVSFVTHPDQRDKIAKTAFINGKPYKSSTQYLSQRFGSFHMGFHAVVFNPSDHDLVRGEPAGRRGYLDRLLAASDLEYLRLAQRYQRILEQRNAVLRNGEPSASALLAGFTEPLAQTGSEMVLKRLEAMKELETRGINALYKIAPKLPFFRLNYFSSWAEKTLQLSGFTEPPGGAYFTGQRTLPSLELLEKAFRNQVSNLGPAEWKAGHTLVGPHRDDWGFSLGQMPLKGHGSQGEVRSMLLALKLAEIELFQSETGHRPLFLLDDFSSELDQERREFLIHFLSASGLQVFITTTEEPKYPGKRFLISDGAVTNVS
ncbi:MAG: hypothetical protein A2X94_09400 [Bdellovibrionales bacterium GWB1_55_8]|nr:MAG: hypothetical protein A2X94_09400 [Bdellovibrionales bacterium GWB1_55_8]